MRCDFGRDRCFAGTDCITVCGLKMHEFIPLFSVVSQNICKHLEDSYHSTYNIYTSTDMFVMTRLSLVFVELMRSGSN